MKGAYCLIISVNPIIMMRVGRLGELLFKKGIYVYVGSAMNSIENRVLRHLRSDKKKFWHIDYLLSSKNAFIKEVFIKESELKEECIIAGIISREGLLTPGFGCSDCKCKSHLFMIKDYSFLNDFMKKFKL